jgi:hypothetical protein
VIGQFNSVTITQPLDASMFTSKFPPIRGVPGPFQPGADWMYLNCKLCGKRAIFEPDRLYCSIHENGRKAEYMNVPHPVKDTWEDTPGVTVEEPVEVAPQEEGYACPDCGQVYQTEKRYSMYHKRCKVRAT